MMSIAEDFFKNGFYIGEFKKTKLFDNFHNQLQELYNYKIRNGYTFEGKYESSEDFRPSIFEYDKIFLEILFENNIPDLINELTEKNLHCLHIQLRRTLPGKAYLKWHRDAYFHNSSKVGNLPPVYKLIYYPNFEYKPTHQIEISKGSNRRNFDNKYLDFINNSFFKKKKINSNNNQFIIFDTTIFHRVFQEKNKSGSFRLIYTFGNERQSHDFNSKLIDKFKILKQN